MAMAVARLTSPPLRRCSTFLPLSGALCRAHGKERTGALSNTLSWCCKNRQASNVTLTTATLQIDLVPCLIDNYAYLLHDTSSGITGVVDPSAAGPVINALDKKGLPLTYILNTHHHWDHTGGNADLKRQYNATVVGPRADEERIPGIDVALRDGETWMFGSHAMHVLHTPGHTRGHVCFHFPESKVVFTGDTLFSIGCGRLFEGSPAQMWMSLSKLAALPDDTSIYCGHEYTLKSIQHAEERIRAAQLQRILQLPAFPPVPCENLRQRVLAESIKGCEERRLDAFESNAKFARTVEPQNAALLSRFEKVQQLRQKGMPTIPTTMGEEKEVNPFLRPFSAELRKTMKLPGNASDVEAFAAVRSAKDRA